MAGSEVQAAVSSAQPWLETYWGGKGSPLLREPGRESGRALVTEILCPAKPLMLASESKTDSLCPQNRKQLILPDLIEALGCFRPVNAIH